MILRFPRPSPVLKSVKDLTVCNFDEATSPSVLKLLLPEDRSKTRKEKALRKHPRN